MAKMISEHFKKAAEHHIAKAELHSQKETEHRTRQEHNNSLAQDFSKMADMAKAKKSELKDDEMGISSLFESVAASHKALAKSEGTQADSHAKDASTHEAMAEACNQMSDCMKTTGDFDLAKVASSPALEPLLKRLEAMENRLIPSNISGILPPHGAAIPRSGQREIPITQTVSPQFSRLVASGDEDHMETLSR